MTEVEKQAQFAAIRASYATPEEINENDWPSYRILALFQSYRKALHGPIAAMRIGLDPLRAECPHFDDWIAMLERYARYPGRWPGLV